VCRLANPPPLSRTMTALPLAFDTLRNVATSSDLISPWRPIRSKSFRLSCLFERRQYRVGGKAACVECVAPTQGRHKAIRDTATGGGRHVRRCAHHRERAHGRPGRGLVAGAIAWPGGAAPAAGPPAEHRGVREVPKRGGLSIDGGRTVYVHPHVTGIGPRSVGHMLPTSWQGTGTGEQLRR
jgi:hypothetical protein